jgi:hypothetical protein
VVYFVSSCACSVFRSLCSVFCLLSAVQVLGGIPLLGGVAGPMDVGVNEAAEDDARSAPTDD